MEDQLQAEHIEHPNQELHPEIAFQIGEQQTKKRYDIHPSLQAELDAQPEEEPKQEEQEAQQEEEAAQDMGEQQREDVAVGQPTAQAESPKERDWRQVRQAADEARLYKRELELREKEIAFYKEQMARQQSAPAIPVEDDYRTDTEKKLQYEMEQLKNQVAQQQKEALEAQRQVAISRAEQRLAADYPDIKEVVSDENIKRLEIEYPHLYNSVIASSDVYTVGSAAYEMIVAKGIYKKPANTLSQITQSNNIAKNQAKPRSLSNVSPGKSPLSKANEYMGNSISSDAEAKALWAEMNAFARNRI